MFANPILSLERLSLLFGNVLEAGHEAGGQSESPVVGSHAQRRHVAVPVVAVTLSLAHNFKCFNIRFRSEFGPCRCHLL